MASTASTRGPMALTRARIAFVPIARPRERKPRARESHRRRARSAGDPETVTRAHDKSEKNDTLVIEPPATRQRRPGSEKKDDDDGGTEDTDVTRRALVGVLAAVALAAAPVADATESGSSSVSSSSSSSSAVAAPWTRQLFDLAGFGAPTGALSSPPSPSSDRLRQILDLDERAASKAAVGRFVKTGNVDLLLQELDALTRLDEKAITESAEAEAALAAAARLSDNIRDVENAYVGSDSRPDASETPSQRVRLLDRRLNEAESRAKTLRRRVEELGLEAQGADAVYGSALAASVLSTAAMHPVDTIKVRRQTAKQKGKRRERQSLGGGGRGVDPAPAASPPSTSSTSNAYDGNDAGGWTATATATALETATVTAPSPPLDALNVPPLDALNVAAIAEQYSGKRSDGAGGDHPNFVSAVPLSPLTLASLYDGLVPNLIKEGPPLALYLGIYEALKSLLLRNTDLAPVVCYLAAGAVGECVGSVVRVPAEAIKSTRQADGSVTVAGAVAEHFRDGRGRDNLVRAWSVAIVRDVPFGAVQIALFEALKSYLGGLEHPPLGLDGGSFVGEAVLGSLGGGIGAFISAPADVVVTRLIEQRGETDGPTAMETIDDLDDLGPVDMARAIYAEGGVAAFFEGSGERVLYWAPAIGLFLTAYCRFRHWLL